MVSEEAIAPGATALAEAKAHARIAGADEDALVGRLVASAASLCEQFTGQVLLARGFAETLPACSAWTRLGRTPVRAISLVERLPADGAPVVLAADAYAIDIDANGDGWVRTIDGAAAGRVQVSYEAGIADGWEGLPEALRQGIVRLVVHLFTHRSADGDAGPPAAVTALWRPWRRLRVG